MFEREKIMRKKLRSSVALTILFMGALATIAPQVGMAGDKAPVTVETFARAETDAAIKKIYDTVGFGTMLHFRAPTPLDKQNVIRMNRDTLYSTVILNLSQPATVIMPEAGGRYMSLHVVNQDHYSFAMTKPGRYELTEDNVGTRYAYLIIRTFIDAADPADIKAANNLQDEIMIEGGSQDPPDLPNWNVDHMLIARDALNTLAKLGASNEGAFGTKDETDPIKHLVFTAAGWGGLPLSNTFAELGMVTKNDGTPHVLTAKDVPVDAFWSVIVYDVDGFIPENSLGVYSFNNVTAQPNADGSITIHFGGCDDGRINCLPISDGWNYGIRMYEPRQEILDGSWSFPAIEPIP